jgi:hypothetical protein
MDNAELELRRCLDFRSEDDQAARGSELRPLDPPPPQFNLKP